MAATRWSIVANQKPQESKRQPGGKFFCWWVSTFNATPFASHVNWGAGRKPLQSRLGQQKWAAGRTSALWPWGRPTGFAAGRRQGGRRYVVPLCSSWSVGNSTCRLARCFSGRRMELNQWPRTLWVLRMWPRFFGRISSHFFLAKPFPKTVFGSLVLGASPLTDVPGTVHSFNRVYQLRCTNTSYIRQ